MTEQNALLSSPEDPENSPVSAKKAKLGNTRVTGKEQFYTPSQIAFSIISTVAELVPDFASRSLLEPAGGTGAFIDAAFSVGVTEVISFDIEPHHESVVKGDFLQQHLERNDLITVSNPPFGRNHALSIPFFNHAASCSEYIVFIVPRSWRKWTILNKLDQRFTLVRDDDLDINFVDRDGGQAFAKNNLRTCVQYWKRSEQLRPIVKVKDMGLIKRCSFEEADASLTIFGYGCGTIKTEFPRKKNTTQMFIQLNHPRALEALENVDFSEFYSRTAYTEALSLMEINYLINQYILGDPMVEYLAHRSSRRTSDETLF